MWTMMKWVGPYLRVKTLVDITKPLIRRSLINIPSRQIWISFKYERLPNFCFKCGTIKHSTNGCAKGMISSKFHENDQTQYGAWVRTTTQKSNKKAPTQSKDKKSQYASSFFDQQVGDDDMEEHSFVYGKNHNIKGDRNTSKQNPIIEEDILNNYLNQMDPLLKNQRQKVVTGKIMEKFSVSNEVCEMFGMCNKRHSRRDSIPNVNSVIEALPYDIYSHHFYKFIIPSLLG